jgi:hypothetical protein
LSPHLPARRRDGLASWRSSYARARARIRDSHKRRGNRSAGSAHVGVLTATLAIASALHLEVVVGGVGLRKK